MGTSVHIKLQKWEQLYTISNDKKVVAVAIDLNRTNKSVNIHRINGNSGTFHTDLIGVLNLDTDKKYPICDYDFYDEF